MPLAEWRSAPFPGATQGVRPVCFPDTADAVRQGLRIATAGGSAPELACNYAFAGSGGPRVPVPIGDGFYARQARYGFRDSRLSEISFTTSPDAFDAVVARVNAQLGPSTTTVRDTVRVLDRTLPQVRMRWSGPAGVVTLVDPAAQTGLMTVDYAAPPPDDPPPRSSAARSPNARLPG